MADPKPLTFVCTECGHYGPPAAFAVDADSKHYAALLADLPPAIARSLMSYIGLFAPRQRKLTAPRARKLIEEIAPQIKAERINRHGRDWVAPHAAWIAAIDDMVSRRDKLDLPLTTHGYLLEILTSAADGVEAAAEKRGEQRLRGIGVDQALRDNPLLQGAAGDMIRRAVRPIETPEERMARMRREAGQ